jgi:D-glycero-D-manno-heptose 1,7-bisphosphate phosphatase
VRKAVFVDRDGVLIVDKHHLVSTGQVELIRPSVEGVKRLNASGYLVIGISNQSVVARGMASINDVEKVNRRVISDYRSLGAKIEKIFFCPHHPEGTVKEFSVKCRCRKPAPGLLLQAAAEYSVDFGSSWAVGDQPSDVIAGKRAGCRTALVKSAYWEEDSLQVRPDLFCSDLKDFVDKL